MNCKYCGAELPEDSACCTACGKALEEVSAEAVEETAAVEETVAVEETAAEETAAEETAAEETAAAEVEAAEEAVSPKANTKKTTAAVVAIVLVAAILIGLIAGGMGGKPVTEPAADPTVAATEETMPLVIQSNGDPESPLCKASYTVSDEEAMAAADDVVATMDGKTLTNGQLQAFYWQEIYMFLNEYGVYAQYMGLDLEKPLDSQLMTGGQLDEDDVSWQQFFLDGAINTWKNHQALALEAEAEGFQLPAAEQEELNTMADNLAASAVEAGFASADELIRAKVGAACNLDSYLKYANTYYNGMSYYYDYCSKLNPTDAEVEAFFAENEEAFKEEGITKDAKFVDVRHVLLQPEGGEAGESGYPVYTDEQWEACRKQVDEIYNQWLEGDKSEESFAQLAADHSVDPGSAQNGGLYENVYVGQTVPAFNDWCFDASRVPGDHGVVKTEYGYHIMFFVAQKGWLEQARTGMIESLSFDKIPESADKHPAKVDFSLVKLGNLNLA